MFLWRYLGAEGGDRGSSEPFSDRESAEAWLSDAWPDLAARGAAEVELFDEGEGQVVYRMSLEGSDG